MVGHGAAVFLWYTPPMSHLALLKAMRTLKARANWNREQLLAEQERALRAMLTHAWNESPFYKTYYADHGITENDLATLSVTDLPLTNKEILMDNFDDVVTDKRLKKADLEQWIQDHPDPNDRYLKEHVVLYTSGSSGNVGVFVYDAHAWAMLKSTVVTRVSKPKINPLRKTRVLFFGATHGRFASVTLAADAPKALYRFLPLSVLDPLSENITALNEFQPNQLSGYASANLQLAQAQLDGTLNIAPSKMILGGDPLTSAMEQTMREAWPGVDIVNMYGATESVSIAYKTGNSDVMRINEDTHIVEALDAQDQPTKNGRVVLTNLYNFCMPLIRYDMRDEITLGDGVIEAIHGRSNDALPVKLEDGSLDSIHPIMLGELFAPGLTGLQFVSHSPESFTVRYTADQNIDAALQEDCIKMLKQKTAVATPRFEHVAALENDKRTGKRRLVIIE